jgi:hypothetical protein
MAMSSVLVPAQGLVLRWVQERELARVSVLGRGMDLAWLLFLRSLALF